MLNYTSELVISYAMFLPLAILLASTVVLTSCLLSLVYRFSEGAAASTLRAWGYWADLASQCILLFFRWAIIYKFYYKYLFGRLLRIIMMNNLRVLNTTVSIEILEKEYFLNKGPFLLDYFNRIWVGSLVLASLNWLATSLGELIRR